MNGRITRNAHHNILLIPEIGARRVVLIGTIISNKWIAPNTTKNPINALSIRSSNCLHNSRI
jgi:hypothetical protein